MQGVEAKRALEILRPQIQQLEPDEQIEIVRQVRQIEAENDERRRIETDPRKSKPIIKPISQKSPRKEDNTLAKLSRTLPISESLSDAEAYMGSSSTRKLIEDGADRDAFFGSESILVLVMRSSNISFKVRPQRQNQPIIIGRADQMVVPDLDLSEYGGSSLGVSRSHASIQYNPSSASLAITDMNTVNGTFINGVKLLPEEVRILRHGDELRLGHLTMTVHFYFAEE